MSSSTEPRFYSPVNNVEDDPRSHANWDTETLHPDNPNAHDEPETPADLEAPENLEASTELEAFDDPEALDEFELAHTIGSVFGVVFGLPMMLLFIWVVGALWRFDYDPPGPFAFVYRIGEILWELLFVSIVGSSALCLGYGVVHLAQVIIGRRFRRPNPRRPEHDSPYGWAEIRRTLQGILFEVGDHVRDAYERLGETSNDNLPSNTRH